MSSNDLTDSMLHNVYIHSLMFVLNDAILRTMIKNSPALTDYQHLLTQLSERTLNSLFDDQIIGYSLIKCWNCSVRFLKLR